MAKFPSLTSVTETVVHQAAGKQPTAISAMFSRPLKSDEQPWQRDVKIGPEWQPLDHGWVETAGQVVVENVEGKRLQLVPTVEERGEVDRMVIEIGVDDNGVVAFARVPPRGESARWYPADVSKVRLRSLSGTIRASVTVHPE
jgi:hypothetical protein